MSANPPFCLLFFIGMPAVGKTYWAQKLAEACSMQFIDLDELVVQREKASITALFQQFGEASFREREAQALQAIVHSSKNAVVACGGGTPCYGDNMQYMKHAGTVVYLRAAIPLLLSHLQQSPNIRPLLQCEDPESVLFDLLSQRKNIYEQAHYIVDAENLSLATFGEIISSCTNRH